MDDNIRGTPMTQEMSISDFWLSFEEYRMPMMNSCWFQSYFLKAVRWDGVAGPEAWNTAGSRAGSFFNGSWL